MSHTTIPTSPAGVVSTTAPSFVESASGAAAARILDALPVPVLVRSPDGRLWFANRSALETLRLTAQEADAVALTRIHGSDTEQSPAYLLTLNRSPQRTIVARSAEVELIPGEDLEVLVVETPAPDDAPSQRPPAARLLTALGSQNGALERATAALLWSRARRGPRRAPNRRRFLAPRDLLADLLRRVRSFTSHARPWCLRLRGDLPRKDRVVNADPVAVAQVVLSAIELIAAGATGGTLLLRAGEVGCRLRIVVDGSDLLGATEHPGLEHRTALNRELAPILKRHEATFEVHQDGRGTRRAIFTIPTRPDRDASEPRA